MQLDDVGRKVAGEGRDDGCLERAGRDDDLPGRDGATGGVGVERVAGLGEPGDAGVEADGQLERGGVAAQVARDLVLGRVRAGGGGERHAWQGVVLGGGEQPQRVPAVAPHVPDVRSGVQEQERSDALLAQVPADGEAGLSRTDDEHVDVLGWLGLGGRSVLRLVLGLHRDS